MMEKSFSASWRIRTTDEFRCIYATRQRIIGRYYFLYYRENEIKHSRLGVVTSKCNVRKAVWRNRVRRVVKEAFRTRKKKLPAFDIVVVAKASSVEVGNKELYQCINKLFTQLERQSKPSSSV
ncbi:ribonuclease P protein component [Coxiella endosymbiont of Ornithodoros amblus]|uniref:ribonuclease P protein component n=1 Tax=Coxiella endosymbiont of Ornithodoros amblus TaxID=1656166 RepID=UPI00244DA0C4|nr:ribonuclease P protein component [Coxiella endosymbiont of Ornithodoros amblus]MBW5803036.1 ribonuclease P protein component [Coxiella endosymbiont of Ornithodoros amblus]